jgi:predicted aspartyl protease
MRSLLSPSFLLALFAACPTDAARFPFTARTTTSSLFRRADISGQSTRNISVPVTNIHNAEYISNITVGGKTIAVMLDTGRCAVYKNFLYFSVGLFRPFLSARTCG